ncbi:molybdate ABC transporter substrate-binding protein [Acetonema longum]|uniref:ABC-type molybdate transport system, periplasmic component n=1 Tax=Acetonema longum DSM 6540 TaxID=1009370 RepID=F7NG88_9FIRM|nr:molybdate ABC transporter substrate-binding protein [Acetonema longum]EGO65006.1 ABC-type molybdate transport system, periplasmic component [Acetonema longum DSM 6540]
MKRICLWSLIIMIAAVFAAGCGGSKESPRQAAQPVELYVSAAASMKDALLEIQKQYEAENANVKLIYNLAASGTLQKQIEQGAPVDLFVSAAPAQMNALEKQNLIQKESRKNLLENQLVLIAPEGSKAALTGYEDLTKDAVKKIAIGQPDVVPAGQYAKEALTKMNLWDKLQDKFVQAKDVRAVLTYVDTGNVDAGIVYRTDAAVASKIKIIAAAPAGTHAPIIYPAAVLANAKQPKAAGDFLTYLSGPEGKAVFEKYGFVMAK